MSSTSARRVPFLLGPAAARVLAPVVGLAAGVSNGALGISAPILGPYLLASGATRQAFAFTISLAFFTMSVLRLPDLLASGDVTRDTFVLGVTLLLPSLAGQRVGFLLDRFIAPELFRRLVLVLLAAAGLALLARGATALR